MSYQRKHPEALTPRAAADPRSAIVKDAMAFVDTQKILMKKGYSESKAFELAEKKLSHKFGKGNIETKLLNDYALNNGTRSFLHLTEQKAVHCYYIVSL